MINDVQHNILLACKNRDRNPLSLVHEFGDTVYPAIDNLEKRGYVKLEHGEGYAGGVIYYKLTETGNKFIIDYCHACECIPCDCGYGN